MSFSEQRRFGTALVLLLLFSASCVKTPSIDLHRKSSASSIRLSVEPYESQNRNDVEQRAFRLRLHPQVHSERKSGNDARVLLRFGSANVTNGV